MLKQKTKATLSIQNILMLTVQCKLQYVWFSEMETDCRISLMS
jgi:hypothetical protein